MVDRVGQQFGNYRLVRILGTGGFADVYLGEHLYLHTQAAIKILQTRLSGSDLEQFLQEARTIARLVHPHIVRVLDCGVEDKTPYLVMDYAPNGTLRQRHPKGSTLTPATILPYVQQVASALQYAHDERFIHRDVKPENLLLGRNNDVLLSDFGIAVVAQSSRQQSEQEIAGTVAYMAPEQLQGKPRSASDQYALGVVVYEWLTGERPFQGSVSELFVQHLHVPPTPPREKLPGISPAIEEVVLIALAKDPKERFASVLAFAKAFEQACQGDLTIPGKLTNSLDQPAIMPTTIQTPPNITPGAGIFTDPTLRTPPPARLEPTVVQTPPNLSTNLEMFPTPPASHKTGISRRTFVLGLTGAVVAAGGLTWVLLSEHASGNGPVGGQTGRASPGTDPTATRTAPATTGPSPTSVPHPQGTTLYLFTAHSDVVDTLAWSPDGRRIASGSWDSTVRVWDALTGANLLGYFANDGNVVPVAWSPDGKYIASGSNHAVHVWDAQTAEVVFTYTGHSMPVWALAWSPDSKRIASGSQDQTAHVWEALTGNLITSYTGHSNAVRWLSWSPDGAHIVSGSYDHTAQVWDAVSGVLIYTYTGHTDKVWSVGWSPNGSRIASAGDTTVHVWNPFDGENLLVYTRHLTQPWALAWSPDGKRIASAGEDETVHIWDAGTAATLYVYSQHSASVNAVVWSPDGSLIASGSGEHGKGDYTVRVWQAT
ncbi:MAG TPA: protein kinase [Ktedonobacterales bacterium]|nr:protein kinase [Ktedonobacterales bacterium]